MVSGSGDDTIVVWDLIEFSKSLRPRAEEISNSTLPIVLGKGKIAEPVESLKEEKQNAMIFSSSGIKQAQQKTSSKHDNPLTPDSILEQTQLSLSSATVKYNADNSEKNSPSHNNTKQTKAKKEWKIKIKP